MRFALRHWIQAVPYAYPLVSSRYLRAVISHKVRAASNLNFRKGQMIPSCSFLAQSCDFPQLSLDSHFDRDLKLLRSYLWLQLQKKLTELPYLVKINPYRCSQEWKEVGIPTSCVIPIREEPPKFNFKKCINLQIMWSLQPLSTPSSYSLTFLQNRQDWKCKLHHFNWNSVDYYASPFI